ncbi:MAG: M1 family aminopeptidase [Saprospiraceae bacterium]
MKPTSKIQMCYWALLIVLLFDPTASWTKDTYPKNPAIDVLHYTFKIQLSDLHDTIVCNTTVDFRAMEAGVGQLRLDLINAKSQLQGKGMEVEGVEMRGVKLKYSHEEDVLMVDLPQPSQVNERFQIVVRYRGIPAEGLYIGINKYGDRTFFSDNWPNRTRHWLATVDHPYDKAKCEFYVTAPDHYQVVSNGLKKEETNLDNGLKMTHWLQSVPIATWLYVLGVADFAVQYVDEFDGKSIQTWVFRQDRDEGFFDFATPTKQVLAFYSDYIGPFAYEKLANIQSNSVSGGMEAASAILYSANSVVGDRNERWRNVVIHEIAHQWFGNAVTEYDWDDVWLSEGFATYFTLLFIEHYYGRDPFIKGLESSEYRVNAFHEKFPDYTIVHNNLSDMSQVTTSQTYQKGSWVLHMLRGVLGTEVFWKGIRQYYHTYMNGHASTADFQRVMEEVSGVDLSVFFQQWLYRGGELMVEGEWEYAPSKGEVHIELQQIQSGDYVFEMPIEIALEDQNGQREIRVLTLNQKEQSFILSDLKSEPYRMVIDPNYWVLMKATLKKRQ